MSRATTALLAALLVLTTTAYAQRSDEPYEVSTWFRVLFGPDGKPVEYSIVEEDKYPPKFAESVKARIARANIQPPVIDGRPVTLRSGVEMRFTVTPAAQGGSVRVDGISMGPMPTKKYLASYPKDIEQTGGWEGAASATCRVGVDGRCASIDVKAMPGMPESVRRHIRTSLERWEFEPQQVDGKPVEGEYTLSLRYDTLDAVPENFREDKFLRILRSR